MERLMARTTLVLALGMGGVALSVAGCDYLADPEDRPTFVATWGGEPWEGSARAELEGDTLRILGVQPVGTWHEPGSPNPDLETSVYVKLPFSGPGTYSLAPGEASLFYVFGLWEVQWWYTNERGGGSIVISVDDDRVSGGVFFEATALSGEPPAGDVATFIGTFEAEVTEWAPE